MLKGPHKMNGSKLLAQLRADAAIARHASFAKPAKVPAKMHVLVEKPISKRGAKSMGARTITLRVKNWQINAAHFN